MAENFGFYTMCKIYYILQMWSQQTPSQYIFEIKMRYVLNFLPTNDALEYASLLLKNFQAAGADMIL